MSLIDKIGTDLDATIALLNQLCDAASKGTTQLDSCNTQLGKKDELPASIQAATTAVSGLAQWVGTVQSGLCDTVAGLAAEANKLDQTINDDTARLGKLRSSADAAYTATSNDFQKEGTQLDTWTAGIHTSEGQAIRAADALNAAVDAQQTAVLQGVTTLEQLYQKDLATLNQSYQQVAADGEGFGKTFTHDVAQVPPAFDKLCQALQGDDTTRLVGALNGCNDGATAALGGFKDQCVKTAAGFQQAVESLFGDVKTFCNTDPPQTINDTVDKQCAPAVQQLADTASKTGTTSTTAGTACTAMSPQFPRVKAIHEALGNILKTTWS